MAEVWEKAVVLAVMFIVIIIIFVDVITKRHHRAGERIQSMYDGIKVAAKRAGLPAEFRPHDLRHRRATTWLAQGKPTALVQLAMGHADIRTTQQYTHLVKEHLKGLVDDEEPTARPGTERRPG